MTATLLFTIIQAIFGIVIFAGFIMGFKQECSDNDMGCEFPSGIFIACLFGMLIITNMIVFGILESYGIIQLNVHHENWILDIFKDCT